MNYVKTLLTLAVVSWSVPVMFAACGSPAMSRAPEIAGLTCDELLANTVTDPPSPTVRDARRICKLELHHKAEALRNALENRK